jgi:integration host factor subunit alpha
MTLTKADIIEQVAKSGFNKKQSAELVEALLETIKRTLEKGEDVMISGFGKFCVNEKGKRKGRNPYTGDDMLLDARRVITFKCSRVLRDKINKQ